MKVRKKPIVVNAVQITSDWFDGPFPNPLHPVGVVVDPQQRCVMIDTPEGRMIGEEGDWLITGIEGELYPCKPDIFEATYEPESIITPADTVSDRELEDSLRTARILESEGHPSLSTVRYLLELQRVRQALRDIGACHYRNSDIHNEEVWEILDRILL